jgi:hypothetical protein
MDMKHGKNDFGRIAVKKRNTADDITKVNCFPIYNKVYSAVLYNTGMGSFPVDISASLIPHSMLMGTVITTHLYIDKST